jgi:hypothetical protein
MAGVFICVPALASRARQSILLTSINRPATNLGYEFAIGVLQEQSDDDRSMEHA